MEYTHCFYLFCDAVAALRLKVSLSIRLVEIQGVKALHAGIIFTLIFSSYTRGLISFNFVDGIGIK